MMNKWFYLFTSRQRGGMLLVVGCVLGILLLKLTERMNKQEDLSTDSVVVFSSSSTDKSFALKELSPQERDKQLHPINPFPFDPNRADSSTLSSLGLPSKIVRNILKYRQKGGRFRSAQDFKKMYGLSAEVFQELSPFIVIPPSSAVNSSQKDHFSTQKDSLFPSKFRELTLVDLNQADTFVLKRIPGIGSGIAKAIVRHREQLGGYISEDQIFEIEWVRKYLDENVLKWLVVEPSASIKKLSVNHSSLERLRAHPYINFYQAKAIIEIRYKKEKIAGISDLVLLAEFSSVDIQKLSPYLSFE